MKSTESTPWRSPLRASRQLDTNGHDDLTPADGQGAELLKRTKPSVIPKKALRADIRRFEMVLVEIGLVVSLGLLVGVLKAPIQWDQEFVSAETQAVVVEMEEIEQTEQIKRPPPPPRPPVPITVPDDSILEDEVLDIDSEIDLDDPFDFPPLPPPPPSAGNEDEEGEVFVVVEEMPELIGGLASLYAVIEYPDLALRAGIEGTVVVQFVIETDGVPTNVEIMRSAGSILDTAALAAIGKLKFKPGQQRGKPVRVRYAMPVRFKLTGDKGQS